MVRKKYTADEVDVTEEYKELVEIVEKEVLKTVKENNR